MVYRTGEMRYYYDKADLRSVVERLDEEEKKYYDAVVEQLETIRNALESLATRDTPLAANVASSRNEELNMLKHSARLEEERDRFMDRMFHKYPIVPSEFVWKEEPVATPLCAREPVARKVKMVVPEPPKAMPEPEPASPAPKKPAEFKAPRKSRRMEASREGSPLKRNRVSRHDFYPPPLAPLRSLSASSGSSAEFEEKAPKRRFIPYQRKKQQ
jgi:hypothetical protein